MKHMQTRTIGIALHDHRLHVVIEHLVRYALEIGKCVYVTLSQGLETFIGDKFHIAVPAPTETGHKGGKCAKQRGTYP